MKNTKGRPQDMAALPILEQTLDEEKTCDQKLTKLAEGTINARAA